MVNILRLDSFRINPTCHAAICCRILSLTAGQGSPNCQSTLQEACQGYLQGAVCRLDTAVGGVT